MKSVHIYGFSGVYFPTFRVNMESPHSIQMLKNTGQKISEYGHFLRNDSFYNFTKPIAKHQWQLSFLVAFQALD